MLPLPLQVIALEDDSATPEEIEAGLREVLDDALTILRAMLWQEGLDALFQADFFASLIGAFELNNLTVEIARSVCLCAVCCAPPSTRLTPPCLLQSCARVHGAAAERQAS